ncbi:hypothetical protein LQU92_02985 [Kocuria sp. LUK]|uniref:Uncharacterized protein n=1 Tax=Kocuria flava TaxID=446860 RepID=A0A2N4T0A1_9MICC|nr:MULTISPECIES: hypothetical protein [Kocuria]MCD1144204.1 hypothetical protein [Kocuria sp. LUK]PLC11662.1 hypothetical protein AUQ48_04670 [Kocuria flava]
MEPELLEPLMRYFAVDSASDLEGLAQRIPGSGFLCFYPNDEEYEGFLDGTGRIWLKGDDATPAKELLSVLEPPFRVAYPVAPAVGAGEESVVSAGVLHTPEELAAYRERFADVEGELDLDHQAHAVDGAGQHWTLMLGTSPGEVLAMCFGRDETGQPYSAQTSFDAEELPLPITVVELD